MTARGSSPALGIGYAMWLRGRAPLGAAFGLIFALAVFARTVPALQLPAPFGAGVHVPLPSVVFLAPVVMLPVLALLDVFTFGPLDLGTRSSPLPLHVRLLPVSTLALVGWPMLFAVVTMVSLWLVLSTLVLHPTGAMTATLWPTMIVVACTSWTQAISWIPCPVRFARMPLLLAFVGAPIVLASLDPRAGDHYWSFVAGMTLHAAAAWATALVGLSRGRAGGGWPAVRWPSRPRSPAVGVASVTVPAFASPLAARRWYETRRNTAFITRSFALASLPLIVVSALAVLCPDAPCVRPMAGLHVVFSGIFLVFVPLLVSASLGGSLGRFDFWVRPGMSPFFALRPVSTVRLVADKLGSAARVTAVMMAWSLLVAGTAYLAWKASAPPPVSPVDLVLVALACAFVLWRNLVVGLWTTMLGRVWPRRVVTACTAGAFAATPLVAAWFLTVPPFRVLVTLFAPALVGAVLVTKLLAAALVVRRLRERRLVSTAIVVAAAGAWCLLGAAAVGLASRYLLLSWTTVVLVLVFVPFVRIGLAVVALDAHRHT